MQIVAQAAAETDSSLKKHKADIHLYAFEGVEGLR